MSGIVVLAHPLVLAVGFGAAATLHRTILGRRLPDRYGGHVYVLLLLVPLAAVWYDRRDEGGLGSLLAPDDAPAVTATSLWLLVGAAVGIALFAVELSTVRRSRHGRCQALDVSPATTSRADVSGVRPRTWPARTRPAPADRRTAHVLDVSAPTFLVLGAASVLLEEVIWRAYLIGFLRSAWDVAAPAAVVFAGVAFGANHLYFGGRAFLFKSMHGAVWGVLFVASGLVWVPIASHAAFDLAVWHRSRQVLTPDVHHA
jgi:membrane protease YdiL (CAAX protease family)